MELPKKNYKQTPYLQIWSLGGSVAGSTLHFVPIHLIKLIVPVRHAYRVSDMRKIGAAMCAVQRIIDILIAS